MKELNEKYKEQLKKQIEELLNNKIGKQLKQSLFSKYRHSLWEELSNEICNDLWHQLIDQLEISTLPLFWKSIEKENIKENILTCKIQWEGHE